MKQIKYPEKLLVLLLGLITNNNVDNLAQSLVTDTICVCS